MGKQLFWYARDVDAYARDTSHLSLMEHGAYTLLLDQYYRSKGHLPVPLDMLYRVCSATTRAEKTAVADVAAAFFKVVPNENNSNGRDVRRENPRADVELSKSFEISEKRTAAVNKRWAGVHAHEDTNVIPPTPTPTKNKIKPTARSDDRTPGFVRFWAAWPASNRKVGGAACFAKWPTLCCEQMADKIVAHVEAMKRTKQWGDGYEPAPMTYLNQKRWNDEVPGEVVKTGHARVAL